MRELVFCCGHQLLRLKLQHPFDNSALMTDPVPAAAFDARLREAQPLLGPTAGLGLSDKLSVHFQLRPHETDGAVCANHSE